jgi:hypothetical protein
MLRKVVGDSTPPSIDCGAMSPAQTACPQPLTSWLKNVLLVALLASTAATIGQRNFPSLRGTDFPDFYCASHILLDGHGSQLYQPALQYRYQTEYAGRVGTLYIHPPFEAVLYLSVTWLPLKEAYLLWTGLNLLFLAMASRAVTQAAFPGRNWQTLSIFSLTFVPLLLCLIQGQDSIVLLLLMIFSYVDLRRERNFSAGCWLALGLFKFQLVLPMMLVLLLAMSSLRRRAFASGFAMVTLALAGLSAAISGWSVFRIYPKFLTDLPAQHFAGIIPPAMPNFRGLAFLLFHRDQAPAAIATVGALSLAALIATWIACKHASITPNPNDLHAQTPSGLAFSATVVFSLLVSYHLNPHDLTLLLLPISLTLPCVLERKESALGSQPGRTNPNWRISNSTILALLAILFLPPLHLFALKVHAFAYALLALPMIFLFAAIVVASRNRGASKIAPYVDHS